MSTTVHRVRAGYVDTDQSGVIHHSVYVRWFEEARNAFLRERGLNFVDLEHHRRIGVAVAQMNVRYRRPVVFDQEVDVHVWVGQLKNASLRFDHMIESEGMRLTEAEVTLACIDLDRKRAIRIPDEIVRCCQPSAGT